MSEGLIFIEKIYQFILALALGAIIGAERSYFGKEAGLRTFALVSLASFLFTLGGFEIFNEEAIRVVASLVIGIGFLGAGVIIFHEERIRGLTTAAALWVTSGIGMLVALKLYWYAFLATFLVVVVLTFLPHLERKIRER